MFLCPWVQFLEFSQNFENLWIFHVSVFCEIESLIANHLRLIWKRSIKFFWKFGTGVSVKVCSGNVPNQEFRFQIFYVSPFKVIIVDCSPFMKRVKNQRNHRQQNQFAKHSYLKCYLVNNARYYWRSEIRGMHIYWLRLHHTDSFTWEWKVHSEWKLENHFNNRWKGYNIIYNHGLIHDLNKKIDLEFIFIVPQSFTNMK